MKLAEGLSIVWIVGGWQIMTVLSWYPVFMCLLHAVPWACHEFESGQSVQTRSSLKHPWGEDCTWKQCSEPDVGTRFLRVDRDIPWWVKIIPNIVSTINSYNNQSSRVVVIVQVSPTALQVLARWKLSPSFKDLGLLQLPLDLISWTFEMKILYI